ncbi:Iron-sulfur cluster assembly protein SufD [Candidatus Hydrogenisulfobacillus filiaventi]|uniref:Iron-sulfur cluster assembly protein SufD n=1 Tax=Candidatus Hydrogenisulfobacillus filiaventi TaxID=2707344 RepID=A0A6F8ZH63_9FIRM|nr:Iron-sulfur cluster assembly protein SufD [Candidatus Hydrogenisulfobacillus filiaventi]
MHEGIATLGPETLEAAVRSRFADDPDWLRARRLELAAAALERELPQRPHTPLKSRRLDRIPVLAAGDTSPALPEIGVEGAAGLLVVADGRPLRSWLDPALAPQGVVFTTLSQAAREAPGLVMRFLGRSADDTADRLAALNGTLWDGGAFLYVPPGVEIPGLFVVLYLTGDSTPGSFPRTLAVLDRGARATLVERFQGGGSGRTLFSATSEVFLEEAAALTMGSLQQLAGGVEAFLRRAATLNADATLDWSIGEFGAGLVVTGHQVRLTAPGARAATTTVFFGSGRQHQDYRAEVEHLSPHTASTMVARGVVKDKARTAFYGVSHIHAGAKGADARQKEQILMLNDGARADAVPALLIDENDVFAAHSASAGPVDRQALYYLMARGLSEEQAVRLYVHGFLAPVIDTIGDPWLRARVWEEAEGKMLT